MFRRLLAALIAFGLTAPAAAQQNTTLIVSENALVDGKRDYCLYAGLAYSANALLTVDVPYRRESPQSLQKRLMRCTQAADGGGFAWEDFDIEQRGTQGN